MYSIKVENPDGWHKIRCVRRHHRERIIAKRYARVQRGRWQVKDPGYLSKNNIEYHSPREDGQNYFIV